MNATFAVRFRGTGRAVPADHGRGPDRGRSRQAAPARARSRRRAHAALAPRLIPTRAADGQAAFRTPTDEHFRLGVMLSLLFAYAELGDADLDRYMSFLEPTTGRWFTRITHTAFLAALETPVERGPSAAVAPTGRSKAR